MLASMYVDKCSKFHIYGYQLAVRNYFAKQVIWTQDHVTFRGTKPGRKVLVCNLTTLAIQQFDIQCDFIKPSPCGGLLFWSKGSSLLGNVACTDNTGVLIRSNKRVFPEYH
jgi:hypothetical protein